MGCIALGIDMPLIAGGPWRWGSACLLLVLWFGYMGRKRRLQYLSQLHNDCGLLRVVILVVKHSRAAFRQAMREPPQLMDLSRSLNQVGLDTELPNIDGKAGPKFFVRPHNAENVLAYLRTYGVILPGSEEPLLLCDMRPRHVIVEGCFAELVTDAVKGVRLWDAGIIAEVEFTISVPQ